MKIKLQSISIFYNIIKANNFRAARGNLPPFCILHFAFCILHSFLSKYPTPLSTLAQKIVSYFLTKNAKSLDYPSYL